ncbi:acetyl/propionyl-CoA carboxylase alpha subunit [Bradyrhizobium embrapense]
MQQLSFDTVLIANRGEIAARIVKTLRRLGLRSAIAYHELDTRTPAVSIADLAIQDGGRTPITSYLDLGQIIAAADQARAGALLPTMGYFPKCGVRQSRDNRRRCVRHPLLAQRRHCVHRPAIS